MREIDAIFWHCSATPDGVDVSMETIRSWHKNQGWRDIGYHFVIELDGSVRPGRPVEQPGAHAKGHNDHSIGICYVGGIDAHKRPQDTRTPAQRSSLYRLTEELLERFPGAVVRGHNEVSSKACPSFQVSEDWENYKNQGASLESRVSALEEAVERLKNES